MFVIDHMLRSILGIILLIGVIYGATAYGETIKYQAEKLLHVPQSQVQGAHTQDN